MVLEVKVLVRFFTSLRELVGKKDETIEFSDGEKATLDKVLSLLSCEHGKRFVEYVYDTKTGEAKKFLQFLINGKSSASLSGFQTELKDGDVVAILPPVGGG
jgi:molybdopterin synthase sulfur carrier subunit